MNQFKIFKHPNNNKDIQAVKQGFCWPAFFFHPIWIFVSGMWAIGLNFVIVSLVFLFLWNRVHDPISFIFYSCITIIPAFKGNNWREQNLISRGYELKDLITAGNKEGAIALYLKGSNGKATCTTSFSGETNLSNDAYKIFLTKKYLIEKNEALGQFILQDKLFSTIDEALEYANNLEIEEALQKNILELEVASKNNNLEPKESPQEDIEAKKMDVNEKYYRIIGGVIFVLIYFFTASIILAFIGAFFILSGLTSWCPFSGYKMDY